jgi:protein involved in polysaccharide export with SLBB domain
MESRGSLFKLINLAGGLSDNHGSIAFIVRELKPGTVSKAATEPAGQPVAAAISASTPRAAVEPVGQQVSATVPAGADSAGGRPRAEGTEDYEMTPVNIAGLQSGHLEQNVMLKPGDLVIVPKGDTFFIAGEVVQPGEYALKPGTSVRQAISLARGFLFKAAKGNCKIFRQDLATGQMKEISVDAGAIMEGKKPDIPLMAADILQVPGSRAKSIGQSLLNALGVSRGMAIR